MTNQEKVKVISTISIPESWIEKINQISPRLEITQMPVNKAEEISGEKWEECEVLFTYNILPQPAQASNLRWVQFNRSSLEHVSEHPLFDCEEIRFTSISGANAPAAAEFIMTALLALGHQIPQAILSQKKGELDEKYWRQFEPSDLRGSTVGIIGYGSVGRELTRLLQPYDVKVLASKRDVMNPEDRGYVIEGKGDPEGLLFHRLYPPQAIRSMLKNCDFVVITTPLTDQTRNLITKDTLEAIETWALLVSISDPRIISIDALTNAVANKNIRGALLDSYENAPPPGDHAVWKNPNIIISPRIAWRSKHNMDRIMTFFIQNMSRYMEGSGLLNRFDSAKGY